MEIPQSEDVNVAAVSSLLSSLSSLSLSMKTTKAAMAAELGEFSAFVREWEAEGRDLGNEADNTQLEALMGVLQEEMRKTEELEDLIADAEYSKTLSHRLSRLEEQNRSLDVSLASLASSLCSPTLHSLTKTNIDLRQEWVQAMEEMRMEKTTRPPSSRAHSDLSSSQFPFLTDSSPFLNWSEDRHESIHNQAVLFQSLVATVQLQPSHDVTLEVKAVKFLKSLFPDDEESADVFLNSFGRTTDASLTHFLRGVVVLLSIPNQTIATATMLMVDRLIANCSAHIRLALVKADLIPRLFIALNPLSLSFAEAADIHTYLMSIFDNSVWLATPDCFASSGLEDQNTRHAVHEMILKQVFVPSERNRKDAATLLGTTEETQHVFIHIKHFQFILPLFQLEPSERIGGVQDALARMAAEDSGGVMEDEKLTRHFPTNPPSVEQQSNILFTTNLLSS
ncbi:hypothetical protein BLNAU_10693 [Blattamonas nauphoetae]|uniref:Uncharacterized protein n=1 Tax=Blattamonas nauphoetae TaxID=2049346 RepID=A0ABQ9XQK0_9EUKA|nr:hypothetical protein BLNAU_10693 [Blattamonas nauphoetae]